MEIPKLNEVYATDAITYITMAALKLVDNIWTNYPGLDE